jgi:uncharacterized membrane protein YhaH (DUF805 family)
VSNEQPVPAYHFWRWDGRVDGKTYALAGIILFGLKNNLDRYVARYYFHEIHSFFNFWQPLGKAARLENLTYTEKQFLLTMILLAVPFIWVGILITVRRLRDAALPLWLSCLFFVPLVNLLFFLVLCFYPSRAESPRSLAPPWPHLRPLDQFIPRGILESALLAIGLTTLIGLIFALLGTKILGSYGWSLYVALPFCLGMFSVLLYSYHQSRSWTSCLEVALLPIAIIGMLILAVAVEGLICLAMAAPIALALAALGGGLGFYIQDLHWSSHQKRGLVCSILFVLPILFVGEHAAALQPPTFVVRSSVEINAPPEKVWREVVAFTEIPPPKEFLFRAGVAYPIRAEISGAGVGAVRRCIFSTGAFEEPITVWDEPRLLKFNVAKNPAPLNELSPYAHIHPRHLEGYFVSNGGQFLLRELPGGRTRLEGTTWYQHHMWPAKYWHWWSAYVLHRIHMRVLNHIRERAEANPVQALAAEADSSTRW